MCTKKNDRWSSNLIRLINTCIWQPIHGEVLALQAEKAAAVIAVVADPHHLHAAPIPTAPISKEMSKYQKTHSQ